MSKVVTHTGFFRVGEEAMRKIAASFEEPWAARAAMLAYVTLCRKANLRNTATFADRLASMAQDMAFSYREAQRAIGLLESIGLVTVERRTIPGTAAKLPSIYHVQTLLPDATTFMPDAGTLGEDGSHPRSPHHSQEHHQELPQELSKGEREPRKAKPKAADDPDFAAFWTAYPRKTAKPSALKAWRAAKDRPPLAELLAALDRHKASRQWQDGQFIPHPATWINGQRWADENKPTADRITGNRGKGWRL
jgi:hypothetical protein